MAALLRGPVEYTRIACRAGRKVSKTYAVAAIALWWVVTHANGRVILTGPTYRTVNTELWRDIRQLCQHAAIDLPPCSPNAEYGMRWPDGREIRGFTADKPEAASGTSGSELLYIVDEASGMPQSILDIIIGNLAGGGSLIMISNPTQQTGFFYDVFKKPARHPEWLRLHISALDSPNVRAGEIVIPGLATSQWVDEMRVTWGEDSPLFNVHVLGEFPEQGDDCVIGVGTIADAVARHDTADDVGPLVIGVDVARFGSDETVIAAVRCNSLVRLSRFRQLDTVEVAGEVLKCCRKIGIRGEAITIAIDDVGVGGGVTDALMHAEEPTLDLRILPVNAGVSPNDPEHYSNLRAELWFGLRDWLKDGGAIPDDPDLQGDLATPKYSTDPRGRARVEGKPEIKKRLGRSPDLADALALACYAVKHFGGGGAGGRDLSALGSFTSDSRYADTGRALW